MRFQDLAEGPSSLGDTFATSARAIGSRVGGAAKVAALSYLGGPGYHEAKGRLTARIMADRLMNAWFSYKGGTQQEPTRNNVYTWLSRYMSAILGDKMLREITGMPEVPDKPDPATKPNLNPNPFDEEVEERLNDLHDAVIDELTP